MTRTPCRRLAGSLALGAVVGFAFILTTAQWAVAQEKTDAKTDGQKATAQKAAVQKADVKKADAQQTGAQKPRSVRNTGVTPKRVSTKKASRARPGKRTSPKARRNAAKRNLGVPEPTVVLKPGEVPAVEFDTPTYHFGRVRAGPDIVHDFWFTNTGTGPLEILKVKPG